MPVSSWYKGYSMQPQTTTELPKSLPRSEQCHAKLRSILREVISNEFLQRQPAGRDKAKTNQPNAPRVYKLQRKYEKSKQQTLNKICQEERKQRLFHSRPVPDFSRYHKIWENRNQLRQLNSYNNVTEPLTPQTLLISMESQKKREEAMRRLEEEQLQQLRHKSSTHHVAAWRRPPFVPQISSSIIKQKPFKFNTELRAQKRFQYNELTRRKLQERWRQQAMAWAQRQYEEYKYYRKLTNFKARPNPWKRVEVTKKQQKENSKLK